MTTPSPRRTSAYYDAPPARGSTPGASIDSFSSLPDAPRRLRPIVGSYGEAEALSELRRRVQALHRSAGEPSLRTLRDRIGKYLISHTTVHNVLRGERRPTWQRLESVVCALGGDVEEFRELWIAAGDKTDTLIRPSRDRSPQMASDKRQRRSNRSVRGLQSAIMASAEVKLSSGSTTSTFVDDIANPLFGREAEQAELAIAFRDAPKGGCLVLEGPPGIGKSRILRFAALLARQLDLSVAKGSAAEVDRFSPLSTLRSVQPAIIDFDAFNSSEDRFRIIDRLGEALERAAARQTLVFILDDAQWTDEFSSLALRVLIPALCHAPLLWLLARRSGTAGSPGHHAVDRLVKDGAGQITLGPLDPESVNQLCSHILDGTIDDTVATLDVRARGNPFQLEQLLIAMRLSGQIVTTSGVARVRDGRLPTHFVSAVDHRLASLSDVARTLLTCGSVFGRPFTRREVAALAGLEATALQQGQDEAIAAKILLVRDDDLVFSHDLFRHAVYEQMASQLRTAMHANAARVVRTHRGRVGEIAEHLLRSGARGDREMVCTVLAAAADVAQRAPGTAADLLIRSLQAVERWSDAWSALSSGAVRLLAVSGEDTVGREIAEAALFGGLEANNEATMLLNLAEAHKHAGQNSAAARYASRALARPGIADATQARLHAIAAYALLWENDVTGADLAGAEAVRIGTMCGEASAVVIGNTARSVVSRVEGRLADAVVQAKNAVAKADRSGDEAALRHPRVWLGAALSAVDHLNEALDAFTVGRQEAERLCTTWSMPLYGFHHACALLALGNLDRAAAHAEAGLATMVGLISTQMSVPILGLLTRIAILRDRRSEARMYLRQIHALMEDGVTAAPEDLAWASALLFEAENSPAAALSAASKLYERLPERLLIFTMDPGSAAGLVRIALAVGDLARAHAVADAVQILADRSPGVPYLVAQAAHARGLITRDTGDLRTAIQIYRGGPRRLEHARAAEDCAAAENERGMRQRAVDLLKLAIAEYRACGAYLPLRRCDKAVARLSAVKPASGRRR